MKTVEEKIMLWIERYQSGKGGIYPYQVALQVCAEFQIGIKQALSLVRQHIRKVMELAIDGDIKGVL